MSSDARRSGRGRGLAAGALAGAMLLAACADFSRGTASVESGDAGGGHDGAADAGASDGAAPLSFATSVYPLLVPTCASCHATGQEAGDTQLLFAGSAAADYPTVVQFVDASAPGSSRLLSKLSGNGHQGGAVYAAGSAEYQTILKWIQQGAQP